MLVLSEPSPACWTKPASNWWVPGDSNPDSPKGNTVLQAGAANRIRLAPKNHLNRAHRCRGALSNLAEGLGVEPSRAISDACRVSNAVASRPPRPLKSGAGAVIRTLCASFGGWLLSQEHPGILGRGRRNRTPLARRQSTAFETARRPFTGALCMQNFWCPRRDLHSHSRRNWFLRPARIHSATRAWSTDPDSNRIRAGLQSAASTASAFSAQNRQQNLAGEEGLEPSNARVRAECSGRCATPQFPTRS